MTESTNCVIIESMKRIDVLKAIEKVLVQKNYEKGHISHRKNGDFQKTDDGWVRVKGSPTQPAPDTDDSAERAEYERQLTEEQSQRAEDDPTGYGYEEPPSSGKYSEIVKQDEEDGPNENWQVMADYVHMVIPKLEAHDTNVISTNDLNDLAKEANMSPKDAKGYLENHGIFVSDKTGDGVYHNGETDSGDGGSGDNSLSADLEWVNEVYDNMEEYEDGAFDDALRELGVSYLKSQGKSNKEIDSMSEKEIIEAGDSYWSSTLNNKDSVQKSAFRDMRSTIAVKNMGF